MSTALMTAGAPKKSKLVTAEDLPETGKLSRAHAAVAAAGLYYDGAKYWRKPGETWECSKKDDTVLYLRSLGLSTKKTDVRLSEVEEALLSAQTTCRVDSAAPCVFQGEGVVWHNQSRILNTARCKVLAPAKKIGLAWGEGFRWTAQFIDELFDPTQREIFLAWLKRFYVGCWENRLEDGQTLFISGATGRGKTYLSRCVIAKMVGGFGDPSDYLNDSNIFTDDIDGQALWCVDDNVSGGSEGKKLTFGEKVKKLTSGTGLVGRRFYEKRVSLPWHGRIVVTLNEDPEALRVIPNTEQSIMDKITLLKCSPGAPAFLSLSGNAGRADQELPFLCRWLIEHVPGGHVVGTSRYGVKEYHHPDLLAAARSGENSTAVGELVDVFADEWFKDAGSGDAWEGTTIALMADLSARQLAETLRMTVGSSTQAFGRALSKLASKSGSPIEKTIVDGKAWWRIARRAPAAARKK